MKDDKQINVLFLPAWYPNRYDAMLGLFVKQHAKALAPHAEVTVLNIVQGKKQRERFEVETKVEEKLTEIIIYYKTSRLPFRLLRQIQNILRYRLGQKAGWNIIQESDLTPDLCHVHVLTRAGMLAYWLKKKFGIPYVITEHWSRYLPHNDQFNNPIHKRITQKVIAEAAEMTTVSKLLKDAMQSKGLSHPKWSILPNVIDAKRFTPVDHQGDDTKVKIFHLSCFEDQSKNISGLLRAFALCLNNRNDLELIMIGDGPDWKVLKSYAEEIGIPNENLQFTGVLEGEELVNTMNRCDFSVLFSNYETFGIVVLESIALGKAVVSSKAGAVPEILPEKFGKLVEVQDESALSKAILELADSYASYDVDEMHAYVSEFYDTKAVGFQLKNMYDKILNE